MRLKTISVFLLVSLITISATSFSGSKGDSMLQGKPFFSVRVDISGCRYQVRLNDVPFINNEKGLPVTVNFPVNELIAKGDNELSLYLMPLFDDAKYPYRETKKNITSQCKALASLQVRQSGTPEENNQIISQVNVHGSDSDSEFTLDGTTKKSTMDSSDRFIESSSGDVEVNETIVEQWDLYKDKSGKINLPEYFNFDSKSRKPIEKGVKISQIINLESSLPEWNWLKSDPIEQNEASRKELYQEHLKLQDLILSKQLSEENLYPLFQERTSELAQAYYTSEQEMIPDGIIECATNNDNYEILKTGQPYEAEENMFLKTYGNNKLAILTIWNNSGKLIFNRIGAKGARIFSIMFRKENGKWIITR